MPQDVKLIEQIARVLAKFPAVEHSWAAGGGGFRDMVSYFALRTECIALAKFVYGEVGTPKLP